MPRVRLGLRLATSAFIAFFAGGCARVDSAADRHASEMREQLTKIQADQDRMNQRLGALEIAAADERAAHPPRPTPSAQAAPVHTVSIGEGPDRETEDANDPTPRPEIRLVGQASATKATRGKTARRGAGGGEARIEAADEGLHSDAPRSSALDPDAKKTYEAALALVQGKHYERGLEALAAFLVRWPDHPYAENAMYWRGEAYFAQGEYLRAAEQFEAVLARFGTGSKAPDALLKIGMCHDRLGASERAKETWDRLKRDYPKSEAARKIPSASADAPKNDRGRAVK